MCECGKDRWQVSLKSELGLGFKRTVRKTTAPTRLLAALYFRRRLEEELTEQAELAAVASEESLEDIIRCILRIVHKDVDNPWPSRKAASSIITSLERIADSAKVIEQGKEPTYFGSHRSLTEKVRSMITKLELEGSNVSELLQKIPDAVFPGNVNALDAAYWFKSSLTMRIEKDEPAANGEPDYDIERHTIIEMIERGTGARLIEFSQLQRIMKAKGDKVDIRHVYTSLPADHRRRNPGPNGKTAKCYVTPEGLASFTIKQNTKTTKRLRALLRGIPTLTRISEPTAVQTSAPSEPTLEERVEHLLKESISNERARTKENIDTIAQMFENALVEVNSRHSETIKTLAGAQAKIQDLEESNRNYAQQLEKLGTILSRVSNLERKFNNIIAYIENKTSVGDILRMARESADSRG